MHSSPRILRTVALSLLALTALASSNRPTRSLSGRFLHLTDLHPDPHYAYNSPESASCHAAGAVSDGDDDQDRLGGYFGLAVSDCDSPPALINATFDFLQREFPRGFDYLVWTGDNARHDLDPEVLPRTLDEIVALNEFVADRVRHSLGPGLPVVASVGNNDVWPHNIMFPGPSKITTSLLDLWTRHDVVPEQMKHTFARGGYYAVEAIPGRLALVSLNTIYFFEKNAAVDGCPVDDDADPGTEQLLWLEQQLYLAHEQGTKVWLTGHVPPERGNWYDPCLDRYSELVIAYSGTVLGQLFGHMNQDHFSFLTTLPAATHDSLPALSTLQSPTLPLTLYHQFKALIPRADSDIARSSHLFSPVVVSPSVIPTYLPAVRVWEYDLETLVPTSFTQLYVPRAAFDRANAQYDAMYRDRNDDHPGAEVNETAWNDKIKAIAPKWEVEYTTLSRRRVVERLERAILRHDDDDDDDDVLKRRFMPKEIREYLDETRKGKHGRKWRRRLGDLLDKHDLVPFEIEGGLTTENWMKVARDLVESRRARHDKKGKKSPGEPGVAARRKGKMWRKWVERMGVRSGTL